MTGRHSSSTMSGANNIPLGSRAAGSRSSSSSGSSGGALSSLAAAGAPGGGSLLKPAYLQQGASSSTSSSSSSSHSRIPAFSSSAGSADEDKKAQALQTIINFNAEQARKRAATSGANGSGGDVKDEPSAESAADQRKRKRKSRWGGGEDDKTFIPGMPTMMPQGLTREQEEAYLLQLKIEDTSRRLRSGDLGIPSNPDERSPSPEPIYSTDGKRMNTREYRKRKELEETRHVAITRMLQINTDYKPPPDYRPPHIKVNDRVMIPQDEYPDINFVGLLIGPRGNTLKSMERETGAKIIIRGKGSVKEGKVGRIDGHPLPGEDEPLHAYVTATNLETVRRAVDKIKEVIMQAVEIPEGQNDLRRNQLRELALLNGTLREGDAGGPRCTNCGATDHKSWQCQDKPNVTNSIVCSACGATGHIARDCGQRRPGTGFGGNSEPKTKMDDEYMSLMAELGEGPPPSAAPANNHRSGDHRPAWQRAPGSNLFGRPGAPRPLMGPPPQRGPAPPPPPPGEYGAPPPPPGTFNSWGNSPPGKQQHWGRGGEGSGWDQPPPPPGGRGAAAGPPPPQHWGAGGQQGYGMPPPPPHYMGGGHPPPPPPSSAGSSQQPSWGGMPSWGGGPPPPPPPSGQAGSTGRGGAQQPHYWQQWGAPNGVPPQPVAPPSSTGGISLSNILSAPPPPPPPPN